MSKLPRYYSKEPIVGATVTLSGSEAHHLLHVMRTSPGSRVHLFDGLGNQFVAEVMECGRKTVVFAIGEKESVDRELPFALTLGIPMPKGDRQRWLIEKLVELGVSRLVPLVTAHSGAKGENRTHSKLESYVIGAAKQSGRNRLMKIERTCSWEDWIVRSGPRRIVAHLGGPSIREIDLSKEEATQIAIGPEGGFTNDEVEQAVHHGWQVVDLGPRTLRMETAAILVAAAVGLGR